MKWTMLAALAALSLATLAPAGAAEPRPIRQASYAGSNWWARYGSGPVAQPELAMPDPVVVEPTAMPHGWNGHDYVYYPGICDYTPPCTEWLWQGYQSNPCRCHPHFMQKGCRSGACGAGGACGNGQCGGACASGNCAAGVGCTTPLAPAKPLAAPQPPLDLEPTASLGLPRLLPVSSRR